MSEQDLQEVGADLGRLFSAERAASIDPGDAVRVRLRARLATTVGIPMPATANVAMGAGANGILAGKRLAISIAFLVGGAVGAGVHAGLSVSAASVGAALPSAPAVTISLEARMPAATTSGAPSAESATPIVASARAIAPSVVTRHVQASREIIAPAPSSSAKVSSPQEPPREHDPDLAAERAALELARTAAIRGHGEAALEALEDHARRFPHGQLGQEREVLLIQALVTAGRRAEARERADRFEQRNPDSLLLPSVRAVVK